MRTVGGECHSLVNFHLFKLASSPAYTFRKESHTKVIEYDLSPKQKGQLLRKRPDVLLQERSGRFNQPRSVEEEEDELDEGQAMEVDEPEDDEDEEEDEGEGDDTASVDQPDQLPRAANGRLKTSKGKNERVMTPQECRAHLRLLFKHESTMCSLLFGKHGPFAKFSSKGLSVASADIFFMDVIAVTPTRFRPPAKMSEMLFEHSQNELLAKVLNTSYRLRDISADLRAAQAKTAESDPAVVKKLMSSLADSLIQLQSDVNSFLDSNKNPATMRQGQVPPPGVKQLLEKKEGLFRKNMMVRYSVFIFCLQYLQ